MLQDEGYEVVAAANGEVGLQRLRAHAAPSLILLDVMMPVMDGYRFRALQREDPATAAIPVFILSAGTITEKVLAMGAAGTFSKPLDLDALLRAIAKVCGTPGCSSSR